MNGRRKAIARSILLFGALVAMLATALPVAANVAGNSEGCTPGFWKNHPEAWQEYLPTQTIASVYSGAAGTPYGNLNLLQGLSLQGGPARQRRAADPPAGGYRLIAECCLRQPRRKPPALPVAP